MVSFLKRYKVVLPPLLLAAILLGACGCARVQVHSENLPPVLRQDEVLRPYHKVADIQVNRDRYGSPADITPADYNWAYSALAKEAARIGADAVILPEVTVELNDYLLYPTSHIKARGVAVKFD